MLSHMFSLLFFFLSYPVSFIPCSTDKTLVMHPRGAFFIYLFILSWIPITNQQLSHAFEFSFRDLYSVEHWRVGFLPKGWSSFFFFLFEILGIVHLWSFTVCWHFKAPFPSNTNFRYYCICLCGIETKEGVTLNLDACLVVMWSLPWGPQMSFQSVCVSQTVSPGF